MSQKETAKNIPAQTVQENPPVTKNTTTRSLREKFVWFGGWGYGVIGLIVVALSAAAWFAWGLVDWEIPIWVTPTALFVGLIGTGLTIVGIGLAVQESLVSKVPPLENRIGTIESRLASMPDDGHHKTADSLNQSVNEMRVSIESLTAEVAKLSNAPCTIWDHLAFRGKQHK